MLLEAKYRVERADAAAVDVVLDVDGGVVWVRRVTRDGLAGSIALDC